MYRQIDKDRNCNAIDVDHFPPHIHQLLQDMRKKEEEDRITKEKENDMIKLHVYCVHPSTNTLQDCKILVFLDSTLLEAAHDAHQRFKLESFCRLEDCRLVTFNRDQECIDCSFDSSELKFCYIIQKTQVTMYTDWLLELKTPGMYATMFIEMFGTFNCHINNNFLILC